QPLDVGPRRKSVDCERSFLFFGVEVWLSDGCAKRRGHHGNFYEFIESLPAKKLIDAIGKFFRGRAIDDLLRRRREDKLFCGIGKRIVRDERSNVPQLRSVRLQEFTPRGNTVKNVCNADGGSCG